MSMPWSKVHVWIGTNYDEDYDSYFELDYDCDDIDDPNYEVCQFCKDINEKWYDEDRIGVYQNSELVDARMLLEDLSVDGGILAEIENICHKKNIRKANAMFFYINSDIVVSDKNKLYNKLIYLGVFDTNLASD